MMKADELLEAYQELLAEVRRLKDEAYDAAIECERRIDTIREEYARESHPPTRG